MKQWKLLEVLLDNHVNNVLLKKKGGEATEDNDTHSVLLGEIANWLIGMHQQQQQQLVVIEGVNEVAPPRPNYNNVDATGSNGTDDGRAADQQQDKWQV
ncbi:hypothetical protein M514_01919 [Trichuris suis]|uniref:Uncharacterized protein n=1 Tax=Trichuris suis TaxID=68888 RepID=A0A085MII8_9BILA|nr:hypothetical protein M513_01919 [Trichuris suis]KFD69552.1 hypothetical protein M514_01919 [Trichuris suis]